MDEIDTAIIEIVTKNGKANISQLVEELSRDYNLNILRQRVRNHADSLVKFNCLTRHEIKKLNNRQNQYEYMVVE